VTLQIGSDKWCHIIAFSSNYLTILTPFMPGGPGTRGLNSASKAEEAYGDEAAEEEEEESAGFLSRLLHCGVVEEESDEE